MFQKLLTLSLTAKANLTPAHSAKPVLSRSNSSVHGANIIDDFPVEYLIDARQRIRKDLKPLITESKKLAEESQRQVDACFKQSSEYVASRVALYQSINDSTGVIDEHLHQIRYCEDQQNALLEEERSLFEEIEMRRRRYEHSKRKAEKWCWVPGYNIYLYVEATDEYDDLIKRIENLKQKQQDNKMRMVELTEIINGLGGSVSAFCKQLDDIEKILAVLACKISYYQAMTCQLNQFAYQYQSLYDFVSEATDMEYIHEVIAETNEVIEKISRVEIEIQKKFNEDMAEIDEKTFFSIRALKYHGNALYKGQKLFRCGYLASLNKRFIALITGDGRFVVRTYDKELKVIYENVSEISFDNEGVIHYGRNCAGNFRAETLIMQDDGNLVAYDSCNTLVWATDTWRYNGIESKPFNILLPTFRGKFRIASQNSMYFDITDRSFADNAKLQLYQDSDVDNQKFIFEQTSIGAYKIIAVHSGKCLSVSGAGRGDGAEIVQSEFRGENHQLFWVLPCREYDCVKIVSVHSSKVLDVTRGDFSNHTSIQQYYENGSAAQMFRLVRC